MSEERAELSVPEMDCPSCAEKVRSALAVPGVHDVQTRPTTGTLVVGYDPDGVTLESVVARVERAGYPVAGTEGGVAAGRAVWTSRRAGFTYAGGLALLAGLVVWLATPGLDVELVGVAGRTVSVSELLLIAAGAVAGGPVVRAGMRSVRARSLDIDLLMGTAIVVAILVGYYIEAATLAVLFSIAELLERYAMDRTRDSIRELLALSPETATVKRSDGSEETVPASEVAPGDVVAVRPGDRVPVDGVVREGRSAVDQSPITGESVPVDKAPGDEVYAGTVAESGYLEVEATAAGDETTLARVIALVERAESRRTNAEQFVDRFAGYYTPLVVTGAIVTAAVPPLVFGQPWGTWFIRGLTLLVVACPCAFVISTPVTVVSGLTSAARNGVLIKGGDHLERMGEVDVVAFDKTGTLTLGDLAVTDVIPVGGHDDVDVRRLAAAVEQYSEHPIASAILADADDQDVAVPAATGFEALPGRGVRATVDDEEYYVGTPGLFESLGHDLGHVHRRTDGGVADGPAPDGLSCEQAACLDLREEQVAELQADGKTVVLVGTADRLVGLVAVADQVRPAAAPTVSALQAAGLRTVMLTGDNERTARAVGRTVGIDDVRAELLPEEKVAVVEELTASATVAMVGDGVNDAPALARADVGVAMGAAGTDAALETADIALMGDHLDRLPYLYRLAQTANGVIRQNVYASLGVKAALAIGAPLGYVSVILAVLAGDVGMSLGVTGNAFRLARIDPRRPDS